MDWTVPLGAFKDGRPRLAPGRRGEFVPVFDDQPTTIIAYRWGQGGRGGRRGGEGGREEGRDGGGIPSLSAIPSQSVIPCVALRCVSGRLADTCRHTVVVRLDALRRIPYFCFCRTSPTSNVTRHAYQATNTPPPPLLPMPVGVLHPHFVLRKFPASARTSTTRRWRRFTATGGRQGCPRLATRAVAAAPAGVASPATFRKTECRSYPTSRQ